jgi:hypothetical protein
MLDFPDFDSPDPHDEVVEELDLLHKIIGGDFVERWLEWNGFDEQLREWRSASEHTVTATD